MESQKKYKPQFSFECYSPKTPEAVTYLQNAQLELAQLNPDFFSVTYGAGGSTRNMTFETVLDIRDKTGVESVPHISCVGNWGDDIKNMLQNYIDNDIKRIVVLRGDLPSGTVGYGQFQHANELVEFIRKQTGDHFHIEVAAYPEFHPQAKSAKADIDNFKRKVDAGANGAITQYFFNPFSYYRFVEHCEKLGIDIPIVAGVMPITNCTPLVRFSEGFGDDRESIFKFGVDVVTELCDQLLSNGVPGLHFFTMNKSAASNLIWKNLGLDRRVIH